MAAKKGFVFYFDNYTPSMKKLSYEQKGKLFDAIVSHAGGDVECPDLDQLLEMALDPIRATLDRDHDKWLKTCEKNKKNGSKGGRPSKKPSETQQNPENPSGFSETQQNPEKPDKEKDKDTTKRKIKNSPEILDFVGSFQDYVSSTLGNMAPKVTASSTERACKAVRLLIEKDGWSLNQIKTAMRWAVHDSFWSENARSLGQLREKSKKNGLTKFQNIYARWEKENEKNQSTGPTVVGGAGVNNPDGSLNVEAIM